MIQRISPLLILLLLNTSVIQAQDSYAVWRTQLNKIDSEINSQESEQLWKGVDQLVSEFQQKQVRYKSEAKFLAHVFYKTHDRFLKKYQTYSYVPGMLRTGQYDCLSGTLLYAYILDNLGFEYQIHETVQHVYLTVHSQGRSYLFEATDAQNGFINQADLIKKKLKEYADAVSIDNQLVGIGSNKYRFVDTNQFIISLEQAIGLQFYNKAIEQFNTQQFALAFESLEKGLTQYHSQRMFELLILTTQSIAEDEQIHFDEKGMYLRKYANYKRQLVF